VKEDVGERAHRRRDFGTKCEEGADAGNAVGNSNMRHDGTVLAASPRRNNREILRRY